MFFQRQVIDFGFDWLLVIDQVDGMIPWSWDQEMFWCKFCEGKEPLVIVYWDETSKFIEVLSLSDNCQEIGVLLFGQCLAWSFVMLALRCGDYGVLNFSEASECIGGDAIPIAFREIQIYLWEKQVISNKGVAGLWRGCGVKVLLAPLDCDHPIEAGTEPWVALVEP